MTKLQVYVEDMRTRLTEVAEIERALIRELDDALARLDQKLMADVRDLTMEHEARRVAVLSELQTLAGRIGTFPAAEPDFAAVHTDHGRAVEALANSHPQPPLQAGDWRQAVSQIDADIDGLFEPRLATH